MASARVTANRVPAVANRTNLADSTLGSLVAEGCKLDMANLRFSRLRRAVFRDCVLTEADFANCDLRGAVFASCDLRGAQFSQATLEGCDLRGSDLTGIGGLSSLRGAIVYPEQLIELAPALALEMGLVVREHDESAEG